MLSGKPPWHWLEAIQAMFRIGNLGKPEYQLPDGVSDVARNFVERCFILDQAQRPSASELFSDPFIGGMSTFRHHC